MDCSPADCSVHGISQARILAWVAISFSRGPSRSRDHPDLLHCRQILYQLSHQGRPHLLWTQFIFRVRKYNSRLVTWALLSHLQDVTCRVIEGQGLSLSRLWPGITSYGFCWPECGPDAPIQLQKKAKECTLHVCKERRKASFLYPIFNSSPSQPHTPHPSTSLCLHFSFP